MEVNKEKYEVLKACYTEALVKGEDTFVMPDGQVIWTEDAYQFIRYNKDLD